MRNVTLTSVLGGGGFLVSSIGHVPERARAMSCRTSLLGFGRLSAVALLACLMAFPASAAVYYWDTNSTTAGAGDTPNGTWDSVSSSNWSTVADGTGSTATLRTTGTGDTVNFVAGPGTSSGENAYTVTVNGTVNAGSINFQSSGAVNFTGGTINTFDNNGAGYTTTIFIPQYAYGTVSQGAVTIGSALTLSNHSQAWVNNSANTFTVTGGITATGAWNSLSIGGTGNTILSGIIGLSSGSTNTGLSKFGTGTLTVNGSAVNTYTGNTSVGNGTLLLDFANLGTPSNLIKNTSPLVLGGGTLSVLGKTGAFSTSQQFASNTIAAGSSALAVNANSGTASVVKLQTVTRNAGGTVAYTLPGVTQSTTNGVTLAASSTTATTANGVLVYGTSPNQTAFGTIGQTDWASLSGTTGTVNVTKLTSYDPDTAFGSANNIDFTTGANSPGTAFTVNTIRFNTDGQTLTLPTGTNTIATGGILVTNAVTSGVSIAPGDGAATLAPGAGKELVFINYGKLALSAVLADNATSAVTINGTGTTTLSGTNTYKGATYIGGGTVVASANANFGDPATAAAITLAGGTLQAWASFNLDDGALHYRNLVVGNAGGTIDTQGYNMTIGGVVSGGAYSTLTKTGNGTLVLSGANTKSGNMIINGGTLTISGANANTAQSTTILNAGTLNLNSLAALAPNTNNYCALIINGGTLDQTSTSAGLTLYNSAITLNADFTFAGTYALNLGTGAVSLGTSDGASRKITVNGSSLTIGGTIANVATANSIIKDGPGQLTLSGTNKFTGGMTVAGGTVSGTSTSPFGSGPITLGGSSGSSLNTTLSITGVTSNNAISVASGNTGIAKIYGGAVSGNSFGGAITLNSHDLTVAAGGYALTLTGGITGTGNLSFLSTSGGAITVSTNPVNISGTITNNSASVGAITISGGVGSNVTAIIQNGTTAFTISTNALNMNSGGTTLTNLTGGNYPLNVSGGVVGTGNLILQNNSPTGSAVQLTGSLVNNSGTITSNGTGSATAGVQISAGVGSNVTAIIQNSTTGDFNVTGPITVNGVVGTTLTDGTGAKALIVSGGVGGTGNLILNNNSNVAWHSLTVQTAAINNSGTITNSGTGNGTLISGGVGSNVTGVINNGTNLDITTTALTVNGASGTTLTNSGGGTLTVSGGVTGSGNLILNNNSSIASGITLKTTSINNTGAIINSGTGSGSVTFDNLSPGPIGSNVTAITQNSATSALALSGGVTVNSPSITLTNNGVAAFYVGYAGISGNGAVIKEGPGSVTYTTNNNNYTGGTYVNHGTLLVSAVNMPATGTLTVNAGGNFSLANGGTTTSTCAALSLAAGANLQFDWIGNAADTLTSTAAATTVAGPVGIIITTSNVWTASPTLLNSPNGGLSNASYYLANNTNFTATLTKTDTTVTIGSYTGTTALTTAYWQGNQVASANTSGVDNAWALSSANSPAANNVSNWSSTLNGYTATQVVPGGAAVNVVFRDGQGATQQTTVLGADMNLGSVTIDDSTAVAIGGNNYLTLNSTSSTAGTPAAPGSAISVTSNAANPAISVNLLLGANQTWNVASDKTLTVSGIVAGAKALTIGSAGNTGTVILSGLNTYSGPTAVNAGTLLVNGSTAADSAVTVANSATLGGIGTIGGAVTVQSGGTYSPGASAGTLTHAANLSFDSGSTFKWEHTAGNAVGTAGTSYDVASLTNGGNLLIAPGAKLSLNFAATTDFSSDFWNANQTWNIVTGAGVGSTGNFTADNFSIYINNVLTGSNNTIAGQGSFSTTLSGSNLELDWMFASSLAAGNGTWVGTANNKWTTNTSANNNWADAYPSAAGNTATFSGGGPSAVDLDASIIVGKVALSGSSYTLGLLNTPNTLTMDNGSSHAEIKASSGTHTINAQVIGTAAKTLDIITETGGALTFNGEIHNPATATLALSQSSSGSLAANAISNDGTMTVSGTVGAKAISGGGSTSVGSSSVSASLTADSIVQNTLSIGAGSTVTIRETTGGNASAVPEPGTWMLLAAGAVCLLPLIRRMRRVK
jgi:fibronectin-binding autotransporter adhesin